MAEFVHEDVVEHILTRLDMKDLIRYKSVCKSWYSLITSSRFFSRRKDRCNKRIIFDIGVRDNYYIVGCSNGLLCISSFIDSRLLIANPFTREVRQVNLPHWILMSSCWGFGYDSSSDDYKLFFTTLKGKNQTCVHVLSLKSNTWRVIREVKYEFTLWAGTLCNGALHWMVKNEYNKKLIFSYDLSNDKFKIIPLPNDAIYQCFWFGHLGIYKECLCICLDSGGDDIWVMNKYGVKESWEPLRKDSVIKYDIIRYRGRTANEQYGSILQPDKSWFVGVPESIGFHSNYAYAPIYMESLVSPHVNVRL